MVARHIHTKELEMDLSILKRDFTQDKDTQSKAIEEFKTAKKYYHGNQLPPDVLSIIKGRGGTPIVENIYKMIVNKILGYKINSIQEVRLTPRQEQDKPLSDLLNDLIRYVGQNRNFDKEIIKRDRDLIMGLSVVELWVTQDSEGVDIDIKTLNAESFIIDSFSVDSNALDARRFHKIISIDEQMAKAVLGDVEVIWEQSGTKERKAQIIESWYKEYNKEKQLWQWNRYVWHRNAGIYKREESPFLHNEHPFVISKFYIDEKNQYYGIFRDIKPMQDYINYAENRMANMMGSFKALFEDDAVLNTEEFIEQMALDNAVVKVRSGALKSNKIQFLQHHADISALSQKASEKRNLTKIIAGLNDESLGVAQNRQSGVAIAQRRETGLMGLQDFIKISDDMDKLIYEKIVSFITHYFTKAQVFRIVDKKVGDRFFSINTNADNKIKPCKFDLIYKTQLKTESKDERFLHWNELLKIIQGTKPELIPNLLPMMLKDIDSPLVADMQELIAEAQESAEAQAQAQAPIQEQLQALEIEKLRAQIRELEAKAHKYEQQGQLAKSHTTSEDIMQVKELSAEAKKSAGLSSEDINLIDSKSKKSELKGSTWQKYPSAHNLQN